MGRDEREEDTVDGSSEGKVCVCEGKRCSGRY